MSKVQKRMENLEDTVDQLSDRFEELVEQAADELDVDIDTDLVAEESLTVLEEALLGNLINKDEISNKSQAIRDLYKSGYTHTQIRDAIGCRYQMVHNVITRFKAKQDKDTA